MAVTALGAPAPTPEDVRAWHFRVLLDGRPIGYHDFQVRSEGNRREVLDRARFAVTVLGVPLYHYEHTDQEQWVGGCLARLSAQTHDGGQVLTVHAAADDQGLALDGPRGHGTLPGCVSSYAYWDIGFLRMRQLLNAQTGQLDDVTVTALGTEALRVGAREVPAAHYRLRTKAFEMQLWYAPDGRWLRLCSQTNSGRQLTYELVP